MFPILNITTEYASTETAIGETATTTEKSFSVLSPAATRKVFTTTVSTAAVTTKPATAAGLWPAQCVGKCVTGKCRFD